MFHGSAGHSCLCDYLNLFADMSYIQSSSRLFVADENLEVQVGGARKLAALRKLKAELDPTNFFDHHLFTGLWTDDMPASVSTAG